MEPERLVCQSCGRKLRCHHGTHCRCSFCKINRVVNSKLDRIKFNRGKVKSLRNLVK